MKESIHHDHHVHRDLHDLHHDFSREKLVARRIELGLTQADVDDLLNTTYGLCGKWEAGIRTPHASSLGRWIDCLACTIDLIPLEDLDD